MKKLWKIIFSTITIFVVVTGGLALSNRIKEVPSTVKEERSMYNRERLVTTLKKMLIDIDVDTIREKAPLIVNKSIDDIQTSVIKGDLTYVELAAFYLDRILQIDQNEKGLNSVSEINPLALEQARELDKRRNKIPAKLYGIPITLKENINTKDMVTSAGTYSLRNFIPKEDAQIVTQLKEEQAIILGKVNLSELAGNMSSKIPSGYSSKHGQTLNPYGPLTLTPSGSSSGSAVCVTVNLSMLSIGTETTGSIISPAAHNSTVGLKPTHNAVDGTGIFPLALSLDTAGPIGKSVLDVAYGYNGIVKNKELQVDTKKIIQSESNIRRIGLMKDDTNKDKIQQAKKILANMNIEVTEIKFEMDGIDNSQIINNEFKFNVASFAKQYDLPFKSLESLIRYNNKEKTIRAKYGQDLVEQADKTKNEDRQIVKENIENAKKEYNRLMDKYNLDSIAFIDETGAMLSAVAGYPEITVPLGISTDSGSPYGLTFTQKANEEQKLLQLAYIFEQYTLSRKKLSDDEIFTNLNRQKNFHKFKG